MDYGLFVFVTTLNASLAVFYIGLRHRTFLQSIYLHEALLVWLTLYAVGTAYVTFVESQYRSYQFGLVVQLSYLSYVSTCLALRLFWPRLFLGHFLGDLRPRQGIANNIRRCLSLALLASASVCLAFVVLVTLNEDISIMLLSVLIGDESFLEVRKAITSGSVVYVAPGLVRQFRDVLLPTALVATIVFDRRPFSVLVLGSFAIGLAACLLSGQRYVVVLLILSTGIALLVRNHDRIRHLRLHVVTLVCVMLAAYVAMTGLLGRADLSQGIVERMASGIADLLDRAVTVIARENMASYSFWGNLAPTLGQSWMADLAILLPGPQQSLATELHQVLGGSALGNAPLGLPADIYLAWGLIGCLVTPPLYILALVVLDLRLRASRSIFGAGFRIIALLSSSTWFSPYLFLLNGGLFAGALFMWHTLRRSSVLAVRRVGV